jgi:choline dehydrogenase-like flavoprotein
LLSGIGPAEDLALVNIPCAHELPVGQGLQDHPSTWITYTTDEASLLSAESEENLGLLTTEGRGPLTSNFAESGGFFRTDDSLDAPDIQLHHIPILFPEAGTAEIVVDGWAISACLLRPKRAPASSSCARACPRPSRGSCTTTWSARRTGPP